MLAPIQERASCGDALDKSQGSRKSYVPEGTAATEDISKISIPENIREAGANFIPAQLP